MRTLTTMLTLFFLSAWGVLTEPQDLLGVKGPLEFNGLKYELSEVVVADSTSISQTYTRKNMEPKEYSEQLNIQLIESTKDAKYQLLDKVLDLEERKKFDTFCDYNVLESPGGKEWIINYKLVKQTLNQPSEIQFNCEYYTNLVFENTDSTVFVYSYKRSYLSDDIEKSLEKVDSISAFFVNEVIVTKKPVVIKN